MSLPIESAKLGPLPNDQFSEILEYLKPSELACAESVCKSWKEFIQTIQWPIQTSLHKDGHQKLPSHIFGADVYREHINAKIPSPPPIPDSISLRRWRQPDPFDATQIVGQHYYRIYVPPYFEDEHGQKLPPTIGLIRELFKSPKKGAPLPIEFWMAKSSYEKELENRPITPGLFWMRRDLIEMDQPLRAQEAVAKKAGLVVAELGHRILLNYLLHATTGKYPDGRKPDRLARTATTVYDLKTKQNLPAECGCIDAKGIHVMLWADSNNVDVGLATRLPD